MAEELLLNQMVDEQDLSVRALSCLRAAGIKTVRELVRIQKSDITRLRNVDKKTTIELDDYLYDHNLKWGMNV
jgi:DNA-directed RNA polymerase subunit alpha